MTGKSGTRRVYRDEMSVMQTVRRCDHRQFRRMSIQYLHFGGRKR